MENNEIDLELQTAQEALTAAVKRKSQAEEAARLAAQVALTKHLAAEELRLATLRKEAEEAQIRAKARRAEKENAERAEDAARQAETRRLEAEFEARQEAARQEAARQERIRQVTEKAHQMEIDAAHLEASLRLATTPREEPKPTTLSSTPLAMIFGGDTPVVQQQGLDSVEQAKLQFQKDKSAPAPTVARKSKPSIDTSVSRELQALFLKELKINANPGRLDQLSALWEYEPLMAATREVIEQAKQKPLSHDGILAMIDSLLDVQNGTA